MVENNSTTLIALLVIMIMVTATLVGCANVTVPKKIDINIGPDNRQDESQQDNASPADATNAELRRELQRCQAAYEKLSKQYEQLKEDYEQLRQENASLKKRIKQLEDD